MQIKAQMADPNEPIRLIKGEALTKEFLLAESWILNGLISGTYQLESGREATIEMLEEMFPYLRLRSMKGSDVNSEIEKTLVENNIRKLEQCDFSEDKERQE